MNTATAQAVILLDLLESSVKQVEGMDLESDDVQVQSNNRDEVVILTRRMHATLDEANKLLRMFP